MASRQNVEILVPDFGGGQCSAKGVSTLAPNEYAALDNIILRPGGNGFRSREGNTAHNSSAVASGSAITGLGYLQSNGGTEYLLAVAGTGIYADSNFTGTFSTVTGSLSITSGQNNAWTFFRASDSLIGVGGAPDAPFKYTGTGNAALLGGSPPSGRFGFFYGNRAFIGSTTANPSRLNWSVLANVEDWTGTGSGSQDVDPDDGDMLITAAPLNLNTVVLFKRNSMHLMTGRESPFPVFPLFSGIGCVGKKAAVVYKGLVYFITPNAKMAITDGNSFIEAAHLPDVDDVWQLVKSNRLAYLQGTVVYGRDFEWIVWAVTKEGTGVNDYAIVWDLRNQCWLTCSTGLEANAFTTTADKTVYMGGYDGKVYKTFAASTYTDASNSSAAVSWTVESDWATLENLLGVKQVNRANVVFQTRASGTMAFSYGYDYAQTLTAKSFSIVQTGAALWDTALWDSANWDGYAGKIQNVFTFGRGNVFKWRLSGSTSVGYDVSKVSLFGKNKSQKVFNAA
jgi:hypothetical protein